MPFDWPWSRQKSILCPDGSTQYVFKNVDHAFPFFFKQAKVSADAALEGINAIKAKIGGKYQSEIKQILFQIDEKNGSVQAHLRASYVLYSAAPCKKLDYLQTSIESIRQDERDIRTAEMIIVQLSTLLASAEKGVGLADPAISNQVSDHLGRVISILNRNSALTALVEEMRQVSQFTDEWRRP